jgi:multicomponent Na+:H+ antiporter subunit F
MAEIREMVWHYALTGVGLCVLVTLSLAFFRARIGPTVFDRILALNTFGTKTVLLICVIGFWSDRTDFLDLALLFSLMSFIGMVAVLRFTTVGNFKGDRLR